MADSPQQNIANAVGQGIRSGQEFAIAQQTLEEKRRAAEIENKKISLQIEEQKAKLNQKTLGQMYTALGVPDPKVKKQLMKSIINSHRGAGGVINEDLQELASSDDMGAAVRNSLNRFFQGTPTERAEAMPLVSQMFENGMIDVAKLAQQTEATQARERTGIRQAAATSQNNQTRNELTGELRDIQRLNSEERARANRAQEGLLAERLKREGKEKAANKVLELAKEGTKIDTRFNDVFNAIENLETAAQKGGAVNSKFLIGQFDVLRSGKSNVLREGDEKSISSAAPFFERMTSGQWKKFLTGETVTPGMRAEMIRTAREARGVYNSAYKSQLSPYVKQAQKLKESDPDISMDQIFGPRSLNAFGAQPSARSPVELNTKTDRSYKNLDAGGSSFPKNLGSAIEAQLTRGVPKPEIRAKIEKNIGRPMTAGELKTYGLE